jgi:hypothetical protein
MKSAARKAEVPGHLALIIPTSLSIYAYHAPDTRLATVWLPVIDDCHPTSTLEGDYSRRVIVSISDISI